MRGGWKAPAAIAGLVLAALMLNHSGADAAITGLFYDAATRSFPWREHPLLTTLLHDGARAVSAVLVVVLAAIVAAARGSFRAWRPAAGFTLAASLAAALTVSVLKAMSSHSCPWDLVHFGGAADFFLLLAPVPAHPGPGRCLPSGHAATGFMWIAAIYAVGRAPRAAAAGRFGPIAASTVAAGAAVGAAQIARGAHFMSHVLLSAALCWTVVLVLDRITPCRGVDRR